MTRTLVILIVAMSVANSSLVSGEETTIDDIAKALRATNEAVKGCTMTIQFHVTSRSITSGKTHSYTVVNEIQYDRLLGRFRLNLHGQAVAGPNPLKGNQEYLTEMDQVIAYDGERTRTYSRYPGLDGAGNDSGRFIETGRIHGKRRPAWIIDPENLIGSHTGRRITDYFSKGNWYIDKHENGCVVAECINKHKAGDPLQADAKIRIWFDIGKGMSPIRKQSFILRDGDADWVKYVEASAEDLTEVCPRVWLPRKYTEEFYTGQPGERSSLEYRKVAEIVYSDLNQDFARGTFALKFPPSIHVVDSERGTTYDTAAITDRSVTADARKAEELRDLYQKTRVSMPTDDARLSQRILWALAIISLIGIFIGVSVIYSRTRSLRPTCGG